MSDLWACCVTPSRVPGGRRSSSGFTRRLSPATTSCVRRWESSGRMRSGWPPFGWGRRSSGPTSPPASAWGDSCCWRCSALGSGEEPEGNRKRRSPPRDWDESAGRFVVPPNFKRAGRSFCPFGAEGEPRPSPGPLLAPSFPGRSLEPFQPRSSSLSGGVSGFCAPSWR